MLLGAITIRPRHIGIHDFDAARQALREVTDPDRFNITDPETQLQDVIENFDENVHLDDGGTTTLATLQEAGLVIIDQLKDAIADSRGTELFTVKGTTVYLSGGPSWGDAPTEETQTFWNAHLLPEEVLWAMGLEARGMEDLPDGHPGKTTQREYSDSDVLSAIAMELATNPEWSADQTETISKLVAMVRPDPGDTTTTEYLAQWREERSEDPLQDPFLAWYIKPEREEDDDE